MNGSPDPNGVDGALVDGGYVLLPFGPDGDPGIAVDGFDAAGSISIVVLVDGEAIVDGEATTVDVLVESSSDDGDSWDELNDFDELDHTTSPAIFHTDSPPALLRATLTGSAARVEARVFPHAGPRAAAVLDEDGAFTNVTKPTIENATAGDLLAALVTLGLVTDDT